jgi:hypothetical protein
MIAIEKRHKAIVELYKDSDRGLRETVAEVLDRFSMTPEELVAAEEEVLHSGNDIEGAITGIAALYRTYPDRESEYTEAEIRVQDQTCLLLRLQSEPDFPVELECKMLEMLDVIYDGAERLAAGFPLTA